MLHRFAFVAAVPILAVSMSLLLGAADPTSDSPGAAEPITDPAAYGLGIRSSPWLAPEDERSGFHLPPDFEIRLFASEPRIAKPLNMAFDHLGRMWVTQSVEYPYAAKDGEIARDAVMILEDKDGDGSVDDVDIFADQLNIPIGILPYGEGCLCFSIPNIWYLRDTDGDGKCDQRDVVLGPFDTTRDTHGMINSFRDGHDGWIYACHGFNNQSEVAGTDGHVVTLLSGNTFRFRPDGSRVEHVTHGQVNPFGMTEDEWGYRYTADCHSKPITQLIRGACYPGFGRPHDGLGFLPPMVDHLHGSTAISGILYLPPHSPIVPLRGQIISGNVMTSRLNRNQLSFHGATAKGQELTDFLTSDDPWFRPVDIQLGPDGHIYVADFYNKIIGHYEVPRDHPERDRTSGRIWQIRYSGKGNANATQPNVSLPRIAADKRDEDSTIDDELLAERLTDESALVRLAALRRFALRQKHGSSNGEFLRSARGGLRDDNAHVARAWAEVLGLHGEQTDTDLLLSRLPKTPKSDPVSRQTIRIAVRNILRAAPAEADIWTTTPDAELASILLGLERPEASGMLLKYLSAHSSDANRNALLAHAAKNTSPQSLAQCLRIAREITGDDPASQFGLLDVLCTSQNARPGNVAAPLRQWALQLVDSKLAVIDASQKLIEWHTSDEQTGDGAPWPKEARKTSDGDDAMLISSLGRGEKYTGKLISDPFIAPEQITFWIAGHNGFPKQEDHGKNRAELILAATGEVIDKATPPRSDVAKNVRWDTSAIRGRDVRIECIDRDSANAFAWIAFGNFTPAWIHDSSRSDALQTSLRWIKRLGLVEKDPELERMLRDGNFSRHYRIDIARTLASLRQHHNAEVVLQFLRSTDAPAELVAQMIGVTLGDDRDALLESTKLLCKRLSSRQQREFAAAWAKDGGDIETLLKIAQWGWVSAEVFVDANVQQAITPRLSPDQQSRIETLTKNVDVDAKQLELLSGLQDAVAARKGNHQNGHRLYTKHCAACHQLRGEGAVVGPQLDGAITRSRQRLLEDIVTPDRNVDQAFRTTSFLIEDGRVIIGLVTAETPSEITVIESTGKAVKIDPQSIDQRRDAGRSLMPSNMGEVLTANEFGDLIRFVRGD